MDNVAQSLRAEQPDLPSPRKPNHAPSAPPDGQAWLRVQTFGATRMLIGNQVISAQSEVIFAILLRLVYSPAMRVARDTLLNELWPGQPNARQRANLRQALYKLRGLQVDIALRAESVQLNRDQVLRTFSIERSIETFDRDVTRGDEPFGLFAPGLVGCSDAFDGWLERTRESVHGDVRRVLVDVLRQRRERADWGAAEILSRWLLQFDPLNEDATLTLAECTMMAGAKAEAVSMLDRYLVELGPNAGDIRLPAQLLRKRFTEPSVRRRPSLATTERHFVGRESELADLTMLMRRARWHDGSAVLLHGPSGIGKTRIVSELAKVAQIEGYREVSIECRETDLQRPLSVFLDALPELLSTPGALGCSPESMTVLKRLVGERDGSLVVDPSLSDADELSAPLLSRSATQRLEDALKNVRTQSIRHAIVDIVGAVSEERPLMIVLEDAHWMDGDSWDGVADLIQRTPSMRLFLVITSRSRSILAQRPNRIPPSLSIRNVGALTSQQSLTLARAIGEDYAATMDVNTERWIVDACEGSPLVLRALVNHWIETGDAGGIPPTLQVLLEHRIDRLHPHALRAMQAVCTLGKFASVERIGRVLQLPNHELMTALEQLEEGSCLSRADASLLVSHELVGRAAIERIPSLVRATIHLASGGVLEAEYARTPGINLLVEALYHFSKAGSAEHCARVALRYSDAILQAGRPKTALSILQDLDLGATDTETRSQVDRLCARLELEVGEYGKALLPSPGGYIVPANIHELSDGEIDELLSAIDSAHRVDILADRDELARICESVVALSDIGPIARVRAGEIGLTITANTCDSAVAANCFAAVKSDGSFTGGNDERLQRLSLLYHTIFGDLQTAERAANEMVRRLSRHEPSSIAAQDIGRAAYALKMCGRMTDAEEALRLAYTMAISVDAPKLAMYPAWQLAQMQLDGGSVSDLSHWNGVLSNLLSADDDPIASNFLVAHFCHVAIESGESERAQSLLKEVRVQLPRVPTQKASAYVIALELGVALLDNDWKPSTELIQVATEKHRRTAAFGTSDYLTAKLARAMVRVEDFQSAHALISEYLASQRRERGEPSLVLKQTLESLLSAHS